MHERHSTLPPLILLAISVVACGRTGFYGLEGGDAPVPGTGSAALLADAVPAFSGATVSSLALDGSAALLQRTSGFSVGQAKLPNSVAAAAARGGGNLIYVGGGAAVFPQRSQCTDALLAYDPIADAITASETLAATNQGLRLVAHPDGNLYTLQGYCDGEASAEERSAYRIPRDSLTPELVGLFDSTSYFNAGGVLPNVDGAEVLVSVGGYGTGPVKDLVQILDPADGTASISTETLPFPRCLAASAVVGGTLFVLGGNTHSSGCDLPATHTSDPAVDEILALTLAPEQVSVVAHLDQPLAAACAVARTDGTILLFGGVRYVDIGGGEWQREISRSVLVFDPGLGEVTTHPAELPAPRAGLACGTTDDDRIVLFGGADENMDGTDEILLFEPYASGGELVSPEIDSGHGSTHWTAVDVDADVPLGTTVALEARVHEEIDSWSDDDAGWTVIPTSGQLGDTLARGRYLQWRLRLQTDNPALTPQVRSVRFDFAF